MGVPPTVRAHATSETTVFRAGGVWIAIRNGASMNSLSSETVPSPTKVPSEITTKTLADLESEKGISETVCDLSSRYLGLPPSKRFYKNAETDFEETRSQFDAALKRLGFANVD